MRRHRELVALVVVLVLVATAMFVARGGSPCVAPTAHAGSEVAVTDVFDIEGIRLGMTAQEVEAIAGRPQAMKDCGDGTRPAWVYPMKPQDGHRLGFVAFDAAGRARMINGTALRKNGQVLVDGNTSREVMDAALGALVDEGGRSHRKRHRVLLYEMPSQDLRLLVFKGRCADQRVFEITRLHDPSGRPRSKKPGHKPPGSLHPGHEGRPAQ